MKVLVLGDLHGHVKRLPALLKSAKKQYGIKAAIQVGDFGFFKGVGAKLNTLPLPVPLHCIEGNHEDHRYLSLLVARRMTTFGAKDHITFHPRADLFTLADTSIGCLGGALHADREQEVGNDVNWVTDADADRAAAVFNEYQPPVIVTHSCPHSIGVGMLGSPAFVPGVARFCTAHGFDTGSITDCGEPGLLRLWQRLDYRPRLWLFGHFHRHHEAHIEGCHFVCVGSSDGTDGRESPLLVILDTDDLTLTQSTPTRATR